MGEDPRVTAAIQAGDLTMFEQVIRMHAGALLGVAHRLLRNQDEAREALQDAFVAAFRACRQFEGGSRVSTWLHRIVVNSCLMRLRKRKAQAELPIDEWLPSFQPDGHHQATFVDWSRAADTLLEQEELRVHVRQAIDRLPDNYRVVLVMRDIEGMATEEVASALGVTPNAVKVRLHRARQALRTLIDPAFLRGTTS